MMWNIFLLLQLTAHLCNQKCYCYRCQMKIVFHLHYMIITLSLDGCVFVTFVQWYDSEFYYTKKSGSHVSWLIAFIFIDGFQIKLKNKIFSLIIASVWNESKWNSRKPQSSWMHSCYRYSINQNMNEKPISIFECVHLW